MGICKYCEKPIEPGQKVKKFRSKKRDNCHLKCYKENKSLMIETAFKTFWPSAGWRLDVPLEMPLQIKRSKIKQTPVGICPYCDQIIEKNQPTKKFRSVKDKSCHLKCYNRIKSLMIEDKYRFNVSINAPRHGKGAINRWKIKQTLVGVCPYCDQIIEKNQPTKKFRSVKDKSCHLKCYQQRSRFYWWQWIIIFIVLSIAIFILVIRLNYHFHFLPNF